MRQYQSRMQLWTLNRLFEQKEWKVRHLYCLAKLLKKLSRDFSIAIDSVYLSAPMTTEHQLGSLARNVLFQALTCWLRQAHFLTVRMQETYFYCFHRPKSRSRNFWLFCSARQHDLPGLLQGFCLPVGAWNSLPIPHQREALQMSSLWQRFFD